MRQARTPSSLAEARRLAASRARPTDGRAPAGDLRSPGVPEADAVPLVVGIGETGLRVAWRIASAADRSLQCLAVVTDAANARRSRVPTLVWPSSREGAELVLRELRARASTRGVPPAVVLVSDLGTPEAAAIAPEVARVLRPGTHAVAAVGVEPFPFEGPGQKQLAESATAALVPALHILDVAPRPCEANLVGYQTPLARACEVVDEVAALAAEALARTLAGTFVRTLDSAAAGDECAHDLAAIFGCPPVPCPVGAAESSGPDAARCASLYALEKSLLSDDTLAASRGAFIALATGRAATLGEIAAAEEAVRSLVPPEAPVTVAATADPSLGERTIAAVCAMPPVRAWGGEVFPSEDAATLEIPAYLRRRSAGMGSAGRTGRVAWRRSA